MSMFLESSAGAKFSGDGSAGFCLLCEREVILKILERLAGFRCREIELLRGSLGPGAADFQTASSRIYTAAVQLLLLVGRVNFFLGNDGETHVLLGLLLCSICRLFAWK